MTFFFKVFGPGQHVFKNNNFKMIDFGQRGNNLFLVALVFLTFFFYYCEWPSELHNFELTETRKKFQNILSRLIFARIGFLLV